MSKSGYFKYDGSINQVPCTLYKSIFEPDSVNSVNYDQKEKIYAGVNSEFNEIWYFYPSKNVSENNRYAVMNYQTGEWFDGTLDRTTWVDGNLFDRALATSTSRSFLRTRSRTRCRWQ